MANNTNPPKPKLKMSYVHHASPHPFRYGTVAQSFDEIATQNPDFECFVFKGIISFFSYINSYLFLRGEQAVHIQDIST